MDTELRALSVEPVLFDVKYVAEILQCSVRHVYRLANAGYMPRPVKLGALVRWRREELEDWIADGCPPVPGERRDMETSG